MTAGLELSQLEGIIPAIETAHAFAIFETKVFKPDDVVVICLSGRGDKDLNTYIDYFKLWYWWTEFKQNLKKLKS